jgi:hypothetical protein
LAFGSVRSSASSFPLRFKGVEKSAQTLLASRVAHFAKQRQDYERPAVILLLGRGLVSKGRWNSNHSGLPEQGFCEHRLLASVSMRWPS